jgi:hypothetical protein
MRSILFAFATLTAAAAFSPQAHSQFGPLVPDHRGGGVPSARGRQPTPPPQPNRFDTRGHCEHGGQCRR